MGYFLAFSIFWHVGATRAGALFWLNDNASAYNYRFQSTGIDLLPWHIFDGYLMALGIAGGWHLLYGTASAVATLGGTSLQQGKATPFLIKPLALISHVLIVVAVVTLARYDTSNHPERSMHEEYFKTMGI